MWIARFTDAQRDALKLLIEAQGEPGPSLAGPADALDLAGADGLPDAELARRVAGRSGRRGRLQRAAAVRAARLEHHRRCADAAPAAERAAVSELHAALIGCARIRLIGANRLPSLNAIEHRSI